MYINRNILHPTHLEDSLGPDTFQYLNDTFNAADTSTEAFRQFAQDLDNPIEAPRLTVAVQSCNDSPEDVQRLMTELNFQSRVYSNAYRKDVQLVLLSADNSKETEGVAKDYGAQIANVNVGPGWRADILNRGIEVAENEIVISTVAHALPVYRRWLELAAYEMATYPDVLAAFGTALPGQNATKIELLGARLLGAPDIIKTGPTAITKGGMGLLAADCSVVRKSEIEARGGYPAKYGAGGADGAMGKMLAQEEGKIVVRHPGLSVHHTHGFGPYNAGRQLVSWASMAAPRQHNMHRKTETILTPADSLRRRHQGL